MPWQLRLIVIHEAESTLHPTKPCYSSPPPACEYQCARWEECSSSAYRL